VFKKSLVLVLTIFIYITQIHAQEFGFGSFDDEQSGFSASSSSSLAVSISGEVSSAIIGYIEDMKDGAENIDTQEMFMLSGKLNFSAQSSIANGVINLKLAPALIPVSIDEAYISAFFGGFDISAGLKKVSWGKADQFGPLDIINMPDQSRMFIEMADNSNLMDVKIANPVVHATYRFGQFSKIECLFLPSFLVIGAAIESALSDSSNQMMALLIGSSQERWIPEQMKDFRTYYGSGILKIEETKGLDFAQAGLRFTTTIGSVDIGMQYFYGRMYQPAVKTNIDTSNPMIPAFNFELIFNKYHQIGIDYAQVLAGFNIRAEAAFNITEDIKGDKEYIYNPSFGYSLGFDRDLFLGINLNMQANGTVRLLDDKVGSSINNPYGLNFDIEADASLTSTRLTTMLSRKFLRDELEVRAAVVWGIEDKDCVIIPSIIWTRDSLRAAFSGCFFLGDSNGQLGQYKKNNFLKMSLAYSF